MYVTKFCVGYSGYAFRAMHKVKYQIPNEHYRSVILHLEFGCRGVGFEMNTIYADVRCAIYNHLIFLNLLGFIISFVKIRTNPIGVCQIIYYICFIIIHQRITLKLELNRYYQIDKN